MAHSSFFSIETTSRFWMFDQPQLEHRKWLLAMGLPQLLQ
jgi:hypothetical protein